MQRRIDRTLFHDRYGRARARPVYTGQIQVLLEREAPYWRVDSALKSLAAEGAIVCAEHVKYEGGRRKNSVIFYYPSEIAYDPGKSRLIGIHIAKSAELVYRCFSSRVSDALGAHLEGLVKLELRTVGFDIIREQAKEHRQKVWDGRETIDIIARHRPSGLEIGVEVKNRLQIIDKIEVEKTLEICEHLGLVPVFAARWMGPHTELIRRRKAHAWEFHTQIYPPGFKGLVDRIVSRFSIGLDGNDEALRYRMPVAVGTELPLGSGESLVQMLGLQGEASRFPGG